MLESKKHRSRKSKILLVLAMFFLLGIVTSTAAAAQAGNLVDANHATLGHDHHDNYLKLSTKSDSAKWVVPHFGSSKMHHLNIDEYYAVVDAILARGGEPSPQNMDRMYDCMFRGDC